MWHLGHVELLWHDDVAFLLTLLVVLSLWCGYTNGRF